MESIATDPGSISSSSGSGSPSRLEGTGNEISCEAGDVAGAIRAAGAGSPWNSGLVGNGTIDGLKTDPRY